jgi:tRNA threonylcarbamoyladenosine biosynthesis protein TsaE
MCAGEIFLPDEDATLALGARWARGREAGEALLLTGDLGAGKTAFIRGALRGLGFDGAVRSPSFSLMAVYKTSPPVLHADLYRLQSAEGLGLEDYWDDHLCLIEWPDRLPGLPHDRCWRLELTASGNGRQAVIAPPQPS